MLTAPVTGGTLPVQWARSVVAFAVFCLVAAAVYLVNDLADRHDDRLHPLKRHRPIASGALSATTAVTTACLLGGVGIVAAFFLDVAAGAFLGVYLVTSIIYSLGLKRVPVAEMSLVVTGFVLRVLVGAAATSTPVSTLLLVAVAGGALVGVVGKRSSELASGRGSRPVLDHYSPALLHHIASIAAMTAILAYALWALTTQRTAAAPWFQLSAIPLTAAVLRWLWHVRNGRAERPERLPVDDAGLGAAITLWAVLVVAGALT